jgi:hypothetical protein
MVGTLVLTGLQWLALKQKPPKRVALEGVPLPNSGFVDASLPASARKELTWVWDALSTATTCGSFIVVYKGKRVSQAGVLPNSMFGGNGVTSEEALEKLMHENRGAQQQFPLGDICQRCMRTGGGNYLANLALFPGRVEFEAYLPKNSQAVVVTPVGNEGVMVAASGTQRGFTPADQAWMAVLAEKLDQTLSGEKIT